MNDNNLKLSDMFCIRHSGLLYATTHHLHFQLSLQLFDTPQVVLPHFWCLLIRTILNVRQIAGHGCSASHRVLAMAQSTHSAQLLRTGIFSPTRA